MAAKRALLKHRWLNCVRLLLPCSLKSDPRLGNRGVWMLHAAEARLEAERLSALYEATMARVAAMEERLDALQSAAG